MIHLPRKAAVATAALSAVLIALTGCSSAQGGGAPADSSGGTTDAGAIAAAQEQVEKYSGIVDGFMPTDPLSDPSALSGKSVVYIPAVAQLPFFATSYEAVKAAFAEVGMKADICDGAANPATTSACLDQALNSGAAGVIMDAISPEIAQESFDKVVASGMPVVLGNIPTPAGSPDNVATVGPDTTLAVSLAADAVIVDSEGAANVVTVRFIDSPVTEEWHDNGALPAFADSCPGCKVTTVDIKTPDMASLPAKIAAKLLADPSVDYLLPSLAPAVVSTTQGATDAGREGMPLASTATTVSDLQQIAAEGGLFASVGWDVVRTSWYEADVVMRKILGQDVDATQYVSPVRVFTADNIGDLDVSQAGWDSSNWFGGAGYQDEFRALWK